MKLIFRITPITLGLVLWSAASRADNIYIANFTANNIVKFDSSGHGSVFVNSSLNGPRGLAFDNGGNLYVANQSANNIVKFDSSGHASVFASSGLNLPVGLAFDGAGNLYVANANANTIEKFDSSGHGSVFANSGVNNPTGLVFDDSGNLYVANYYGNNVEKFDHNGNGSVFASFPDPFGLAYRNGYIYLGSGATNAIQKIDSSGHVTLFASGSGLISPQGLAFDSAGNLYAPNFHEDTVIKLDVNGKGSLFASTPLDGPMFVAIVPEPSLSAILALGVGLILPRLRPRRS